MKDYSQLSDSSLVLLIKEGKAPEAAFSELYSRHKPKVWSFCVYMLGMGASAEDVFQDVFFNLYTKIKEGRRIKNPSSYIMSSARNLCLNCLRNRKSNVPLESAMIKPDEEFPYEKKELYELIITSLELLDLKYKEAFVLSKIEGFSSGEIAEICGISEEGVKTRVKRARLRILEILEPYLKDLCK